MNSEFTNSLSGFASSVNSLIPVTSILTVLGIAIGSAFSIYIIVWGAKKIVNSVKLAIDGKLISFEFTDYIAFKSKGTFSHLYSRARGYKYWQDFRTAVDLGYVSSKDYYSDMDEAYSGNYNGIKNAKMRAYYFNDDVHDTSDDIISYVDEHRRKHSSLDDYFNDTLD